MKAVSKIIVNPVNVGMVVNYMATFFMWRTRNTHVLLTFSVIKLGIEYEISRI